MKKIISILLMAAVLICTVAAAGCIMEEEQDLLVGTWLYNNPAVRDTMQIDVYPDGTGTFSYMNKNDGGTNEITWSKESEYIYYMNNVIRLQVSSSGNTLSLITPYGPLIFERV